MNWNYKGLEALAVFSISTLVLLIVRWSILRSLGRVSTGPDSFAQIVHQYLKTPSLLWVLSGSLELGLSVFDLDPRWQRLIENAIVAFVIFSMALMLGLWQFTSDWDFILADVWLVFSLVSIVGYFYIPFIKRLEDYCWR